MSQLFLGHANFKELPFSQDKIPSGSRHQHHKPKLKGEGKQQMPKREKEGGCQIYRQMQYKSDIKIGDCQQEPELMYQQLSSLQIAKDKFPGTPALQNKEM